ncbi:biopolymer transporter ExbD [Haloferula sp. BvORR071]|uniref:ExbD/TolR family protein n=1 Tax=Haloferula sp. BvORR071 TaxID=1396141 RepID=UPI000559439B|nr:biopolymer transporter ExbD [Haloferula sp. BvORR071]
MRKKSPLRHRRASSSEVNLGFQIAPMIDVVFVILLFFMVKAASVQEEKAHVTKLPGIVPSVAPMPDEIAIAVGDDGQVYLNEDPSDAPDSRNLPQLAANLVTLRQAADATQNKVLVTIYADEMAEYQRVVDVLDALTRAKISDVSFQIASAD